MIAYSSLTVKEAIDAVTSKLSQFETSSALDDKTVFLFLEDARREIFTRFMPFKDWAFLKEVAVADGDVLPDDFIRLCTLRSKSPSASEYSPSRAISIKELWTLGNTDIPQTYDRATPSAPVHCIYGNDDPAEDRLCIHLRPADVTGYLEYYSAPEDLPRDVNDDFDGTALLNIPYELENYLENATLMRCYIRIGAPAKVAEAVAIMQKEKMKLLGSYQAENATQAITMESLANPEPSATPNTALLGDVNAR